MNYKQTDLAGTSWVRCRTVTINNPLSDAVPIAYFQEEKVVSVGGVNLKVDVGSCAKAFDPAATIALLDPATGEPTGETATHAELYSILFSLYMQTALERDASLVQ